MNRELNQCDESVESTPFITVAMPVYNAGPHLRDAVLSIILQTYTHWQLFIIDDGSTDNALDSIRDIRDDRIRVLRDGDNKGLAARLNQAIDLAEGEYFARMDQDDISYPTRFERQVAALCNDAALDLTCVRAVTISEDGEIVGYLPYQLTHAEITASPWRGFHMPHPTWMGRTAWFKRHRYSSDRPYFCEDQELLLRSYEASKFACVPEILFAYRLRAKNSLAKLSKIRKTILMFRLKYFMAAGKLACACLAIINYFLNLAKDWMQSVFSITYAPHKICKVQSLDVAEYKKLQMIIKNTRD